MKIKVFLFILLSMFFLGCSNKLNMGYFSVVEKGYIFNPTAPIVIVYDKNDLLSSTYINLIVYELQRQGFTSIYKQDELPFSRAKNAIVVKIFRSIQAYPNVNFNYSTINDGVSQACYWYGSQFYCDTKGNKIVALTGYSESLNYLSSYHFVLDWYDLNLKKRVLYIDGSVNGRTCSYNLLFRDLISHTITRIDFRRTEYYQYYSPLPYYWPCQ